MSDVQPPPPPWELDPSPTKRDRSGAAIVVVSAVVIVLLVTGVLVANRTPQPEPAVGGVDDDVEVPATRPTIKACWSGTARSVSITLSTGGGGTSQASNRRNNQCIEPGYSLGSFAYLSVQNEGSSGTVECEIVVNGEVVKRSSSDGGYVIATCSGRI